MNKFKGNIIGNVKDGVNAGITFFGEDKTANSTFDSGGLVK